MGLPVSRRWLDGLRWGRRRFGACVFVCVVVAVVVCGCGGGGGGGGGVCVCVCVVVVVVVVGGWVGVGGGGGGGGGELVIGPTPFTVCLVDADEDLLAQELRAGVLKPSYVLVRWVPRNQPASLQWGAATLSRNQCNVPSPGANSQACRTTLG